MPGNSAWEDVATAETEGDDTDRLEEPDAKKPADEGISEAGGRGTEEPLRDTTALRDAATDDSGAHDLMDTDNPGDVTASIPLRRTPRFRKKNQGILNFVM